MRVREVYPVELECRGSGALWQLDFPLVRLCVDELQERGELVAPVQARVEVGGVAAHDGEVLRHDHEDGERRHEPNTACHEAKAEHDGDGREREHAEQVEHEAAQGGCLERLDGGDA